MRYCEYQLCSPTQYLDIVIRIYRTTKMFTRLCACAGWSGTSHVRSCSIFPSRAQMSHVTRKAVFPAYGNRECPDQSAAYTQYPQSIFCPLIFSTVSNDSWSGQRSPWSDWSGPSLFAYAPTAHLPRRGSIRLLDTKTNWCNLSLY